MRGVGAEGSVGHVLAKLGVFFEKMVETDGVIDDDDSYGASSRDQRDASYDT